MVAAGEGQLVSVLRLLKAKERDRGMLQMGKEWQELQMITKEARGLNKREHGDSPGM